MKRASRSESFGQKTERCSRKPSRIQNSTIKKKKTGPGAGDAVMYPAREAEGF